MNSKNILKQFVPPILLILKRKMLNRKVILHESPLPQIEHHSDKMIVIGNGPSLNKSIECYYNEIVSSDKIVVNYFASTDLYVELKPNVYVLADPDFFDMSNKYNDLVMSLADNIVKKTTWPMHLIIPLSASNSSLLVYLRQNRNVIIDSFYNGFQDVGKRTKFEAWDENLVAPPAQTVLNTCVYLSLFWNYRETYLIGADTSFLEDVRIDQQTNKLYVVDKHFYNAKDVYTKDFSDSISKHGTEMVGWKLHDLICAYGNMFKMYAELKEYADYKGLKVYNASEYSWINVFERKKLR